MIERSGNELPEGEESRSHHFDRALVLHSLRYAVEVERLFGIDRISVPKDLPELIGAPTILASHSPIKSPTLSPTRPQIRAPQKAIQADPLPEQESQPPGSFEYPCIPLDVRERELEKIRQASLACQLCGLHKERTQVVFSDGPVTARLMLVGEGPGADEDRTGIPFVGKAGQLLNKIISAMGLRREDVYIANVVKCRPPSNRTPLVDEAAKCFPYLQKQIELVQPEVIGALGMPALHALLKLNTSMARARGRIFRLGAARVVPTYHPAYLLRCPNEKAKVWQDVQVMMKLLGLPSEKGS